MFQKGLGSGAKDVQETLFPAWLGGKLVEAWDKVRLPEVRACE